MLNKPLVVYILALALSLGVSYAYTWLMRRLALRWGAVDHPGPRKVHAEPMPLLGGVAIVGTFYLVVLVLALAFTLMEEYGADWFESRLAFFLGEQSRRKLAGLFAGSALVFLLGLVDDFKALTPWLKLAGQVAAALVLVLSGVCFELFDLPYPIAAAATVFWIVLVTNAMNLLDNMDGLCAGVSIVAAFSFFLCVQAPYDDQFIRVLLMVFIGSVGGFLWHNFAPARIFMGDAGAMFNGYVLATVAVLGTFHVVDTSSRIAVAAPVLALSVPLFDTFSVIYIRWRRGQSIMKGDKRHFSHRLVELGMTPRQAVLFIFLVGAVVGLGAALLPSLGRQGTLIVLGQTLGVYLLIVLLMEAGKRSGRGTW